MVIYGGGRGQSRVAGLPCRLTGKLRRLPPKPFIEHSFTLDQLRLPRDEKQRVAIQHQGHSCGIPGGGVIEMDPIRVGQVPPVKDEQEEQESHRLPWR